MYFVLLVYRITNTIFLDLGHKKIPNKLQTNKFCLTFKINLEYIFSFFDVIIIIMFIKYFHYVVIIVVVVVVKANKYIFIFIVFFYINILNFLSKPI